MGWWSNERDISYIGRIKTKGTCRLQRERGSGNKWIVGIYVGEETEECFLGTWGIKLCLSMRIGVKGTFSHSD